MVKKELNEKSENYTSLQLDFQKMSDEKKSIEEQLADVKPLISSKEEQLKVTMRYVVSFYYNGRFRILMLKNFFYMEMLCDF